eukprot:754173-Hanusia_phi.AAC.1
MALHASARRLKSIGNRDRRRLLEPSKRAAQSGRAAPYGAAPMSLQQSGDSACHDSDWQPPQRQSDLIGRSPANWRGHKFTRRAPALESPDRTVAVRSRSPGPAWQVAGGLVSLAPPSLRHLTESRLKDHRMSE